MKIYCRHNPRVGGLVEKCFLFGAIMMRAIRIGDLCVEDYRYGQWFYMSLLKDRFMFTS